MVANYINCILYIVYNTYNKQIAQQYKFSVYKKIFAVDYVIYQHTPTIYIRRQMSPVGRLYMVIFIMYLDICEQTWEE